MTALSRLARITGVLVAALVATLAVTAGVLVATAPAPPALPDDVAVTVPASPVAQPQLRAELLRRFQLDQAVREGSSAAISDLQSVRGLWRFAQTAVRMERTDGPNRRRVADLVAANGWPTAADIGPDGLEALFYLVQHATPDLQRAALEPFRAAWRDGALDGALVAMLTDRIRVGENRPQLYGTQFGATPGHPMALQPIEDVARVDARRATMGLPPLAEYLDQICAEADLCVERPS